MKDRPPMPPQNQQIHEFGKNGSEKARDKIKGDGEGMRGAVG